MLWVISSKVDIKGSGRKLLSPAFQNLNSSVMEIAMNYEIGFGNNKLGKVVLNQKYEVDDNSSDGTAKLNVVFSAENVNTEVVITDATESEYLYIYSDELPRMDEMDELFVS